MNSRSIPDELRVREQWVCWRTEVRDGKDTKVPLKPSGDGYADVTESSTWTGYDSALAQYRGSAAVDGIGFVFSADDPYVGVDLDDCRDPRTGAVPDLATEIIAKLDSYTEVSPSGTGVHVILKDAVPDGGNRRGSVEIYEQDRFFTMTGEHVEGTPEAVEDRAEALAAIHETYIAKNTEVASSESRAPIEPAAAALEDEELIERAMDAANGTKFEALWNGDISGYDSHSEADQALCNMLAFWTGGDSQRINRLFEQSGLAREKWWDRPDYRERTIRKAIRGTNEFYRSGTE